MTMPGVAAFESHRARLFAVAYRMLGSASEAEDVVQDAWLRYDAADRSDVRSTEAFLTTIVTRLCLDRLKSARVTREQYVGPWLPEPILMDTRQAPEQAASLAQSLTLAFMVLLETLSPEERAVFLLREVFEYSYAEIAVGIRRTAAAIGIPLDQITLTVFDVNNEPAVLIRVGDRLDSVYACEVAAGRIAAIRVVRNPDKLTFIVRQLKS